MSSQDNWTSWVSGTGLLGVAFGFILHKVSNAYDYQEKRLEKAVELDSRAFHAIHTLLVKLPMLVALRGRINSDSPKECELSKKRAVMHQAIEEELWSKERENGRMSIETVEVRRSIEQRDWFLECGSSVRVKVENANKAMGIDSAMETNQIFIPEDDKPTLSNLYSKMMQMSKSGIRKTETYLPVDTVVTAIGELRPNDLASKSDAESGTPKFILQEPRYGPFHITTATLNQLKESYRINALLYKWAAVAAGAAGVAFLTYRVVERFLTWRRGHVQRQRQKKANERFNRMRENEGREAATQQEESDHDRDVRLYGACVICMESASDIVFTPCGHLCCCSRCGTQLPRPVKCPLCRVIAQPVKVYRD